MLVSAVQRSGSRGRDMPLCKLCAAQESGYIQLLFIIALQCLQITTDFSFIKFSPLMELVSKAGGNKGNLDIFVHAGIANNTEDDIGSGSTACLIISAASLTSNSDRLSPPVTLNNTPWRRRRIHPVTGWLRRLWPHPLRGSGRCLYRLTSRRVRHLS